MFLLNAFWRLWRCKMGFWLRQSLVVETKWKCSLSVTGDLVKKKPISVSMWSGKSKFLKMGMCAKGSVSTHEHIAVHYRITPSSIGLTCVLQRFLVFPVVSCARWSWARLCRALFFSHPLTLIYWMLPLFPGGHLVPGPGNSQLFSLYEIQNETAVHCSVQGCYRVLLLHFLVSLFLKYI